MRTPASLMHSADISPSSDLSSPAPPSPAITIDSDMVVILASLLCALICVTGLALVARCACNRARRPATASTSSASPPPPPPKGLKKKAIEALPTVPFAAAAAAQGQGDCAICLTEFAVGEELRVLPHCGHGFHTACIDTWLGAHATCPSCRASIASSSPPSPPLPGRCRRCGANGDDDVAAATDDCFLP